MVFTQENSFEKSKEYYNKALAIIPGVSQTMSKRPENYALGAFPIYIERGKGSHVWDVDGNEYIDYLMATGPITLGYSYPPINEAVKEQLERGIVFSLMHPLEIEVSEALIEVIPSAEMVRFFKTGAEATSAAVRIARAYTGKEKIVHCGYHGWHDNWTAEREVPFSLGVPRVLKDYICSFKFNDSTSQFSLKKVLERNEEEVACIVMEMVVDGERPEEGYLEWVRELADKYKAVLIFDEIKTGFRMALGGAQEYFSIIPDLTCLAKGIANGFPLAAVVGKREIMKIAEKLFITTTYGGETLSLVAALVCLREYRKKKVVEHIWKQGSKLMKGLTNSTEKIGLNAECKGFPPMFIFKFEDKDPDLTRDINILFLQELARRGILFNRHGNLFITYSHTDKDIEQTLDACEEVMHLIKDAYKRDEIESKLQIDKRRGFDIDRAFRLSVNSYAPDRSHTAPKITKR